LIDDDSESSPDVVPVRKADGDHNDPTNRTVTTESGSVEGSGTVLQGWAGTDPAVPSTPAATAAAQPPSPVALAEAEPAGAGSVPGAGEARSGGNDTGSDGALDALVADTQSDSGNMFLSADLGDSTGDGGGGVTPLSGSPGVGPRASRRGPRGAAGVLRGGWRDHHRGDRGRRGDRLALLTEPVEVEGDRLAHLSLAVLDRVAQRHAAADVR